MTGLVGWWPLHENSGSKAYDLSGNGNHGSLNGGITQGVSGKGGLTAYSFDGSSGMVSNSSTISGLGVNTSCTVTCWFYPRSNGGVLVNYKNGSSDRFATSFNNGEINAAMYDGSWKGEKSAPASLNEWHHFAAVWDGSSTMKLYLDGESVGSSGSSTSTRRETGTYIGRKQNGEQPFDGLILDARLYDRILSPQEIQELYNSGNGDYARPLNDENSSSAVSRWPLDGDTDDVWGSNNSSDTGILFDSSNSVRGQAIDTTSSNNYIDTGLVLDNSVFTVSAWGYARSIPNFRFLVSSNDGSNGLGLGSTGGNWLFNVSSNDTYVYGSESYTDAWVHLVGVFDNGNLKLYTNGQLDGESSGGTNDTNKSLRIGSDYTGNNPWNGWIDDVRIYDKALSPSEVFELYRWGTRGRDMRKFTVNSRGL